jgi:hypothetical protein
VTGTRALLVLLGVLALSACGSSSAQHPSSEPQATAKVTPAIEAIDVPAPDAGWHPLPDHGDAVIKTTWSLCFSDPPKTDGQDDCAPTPDQAEHADQMEAEFEQAVQPAKSTTPRAIAELRLPTRGAKARARFITWRNGAGKLCAETDEEDEDGGGGGGPSGPCVPGEQCANLCVGLSGSSGEGVYDYLLSGLVASEADDLRITLDDGRVEDAALTGPVVPGVPKYRVFMLDLGRDLYRRVELRRGGKVLAEEKVSDAVIRVMRCEDSGPPALPSQGEQSTHGDRCVQRAGPK